MWTDNKLRAEFSRYRYFMFVNLYHVQDMKTRDNIEIYFRLIHRPQTYYKKL